MIKQTLIITLLLASTFALFSDDSAVFKLTAKNFKDLVVNSDDFWLVEFYGNSRLMQLLGVVIVNDQLLNSKKQPKY